MQWPLHIPEAGLFEAQKGLLIVSRYSAPEPITAGRLNDMRCSPVIYCFDMASLISGIHLYVRLLQLNVIFLGIALYKMFHHTAILKPDSGCLDNIK